MEEFHDQLVGSCYGVASNSTCWTPNTFMDTDNHGLNPNINQGEVLNPRDITSLRPKNNHDATTGMQQWTDNNIRRNIIGDQGFIQEHHPSAFSFGEEEDLNFTVPSNYLKLNHLHQHHLGGCQKNLLGPSEGLFYPNNIAHHCYSCDESFGAVGENGCSYTRQALIPTEMNLEALDLLTTASFGGTPASGHSHGSTVGPFNDSDSSFGLHLPIHPPLNTPKIPGITCGFIEEETKRPRGFMGSKASLTAPKKPRSEPPFKVKKEKLGDRISTLQQLVAPFGKTDTASVLTETIVCIKFYQSRIEALSVPFMKSARNKFVSGAGRSTAVCHPQGSAVAADQKEAPPRDLASRGLCLVPLSHVTAVSAAESFCCPEIWQI